MQLQVKEDGDKYQYLRKLEDLYKGIQEYSISMLVFQQEL